MTNKALIVVDVQVDFCEGGALAVDGGREVAENIAAYLLSDEEDFYLRVASKDWHIDPGTHFSDTPDFIDSWPVHCVAGSDGAEFQSPLRRSMFDGVFYKGQHSAAYSAFEGSSSDTLKSGLDAVLTHCDIEVLHVVGLALDYCVRATCLDAINRGYDVVLHADMVASVHTEDETAVIEELEDAGVEVVYES